MSPARIGVTSPAITATIASSSSATPSAMLSESNERAPAPRARKRRQITIAKPASDLGRLREYGVACRGIALHDALDGGRNQQIPANDAVEVRLVEDAFSSREPARRWRDGAALQQPKRQPGRGSGGPFVVASIEECLMRARPEGLALGIASDEVGRRRKSFEVFGFQRCFTVGRFEQAIRFRPRPSLECLPGPPERLHVGHVASARNGRSIGRPYVDTVEFGAALWRNVNRSISFVRSVHEHPCEATKT